MKKTFLITAKLDELFPCPAIPLKHSNPYTLLIAVLLSAQSTDIRVNEITKALFKKASSPEEMVKLSYAEIEKLIRPCGLGPTKAKHILKLSKILLERHRGKVPKTFTDLEALPGIGHKSASVIMSQAFQKPAFPVDTHIHRLAKRWGLSSGVSVVQTEKDLKKAFPKRLWGKIHLQMIYYGRKYCPARGHKIDSCPICKAL